MSSLSRPEGGRSRSGPAALPRPSSSHQEEHRRLPSPPPHHPPPYHHGHSSHPPPPPPPHHHHPHHPPPPPPPHHFYHPHPHPPPPPPPMHPHYYYEYYYGIPPPWRAHLARRMANGRNNNTQVLLPYEDPMEQPLHDAPSDVICGSSLSLRDWLRFGRVFGAKIVLEVFGAAGAIWGFSEIVMLRTSETNEQWRKIAIVVGIVFFLRYMVHARTYLKEAVAEKLSVVASNSTINNSLELGVDDFLPTTTTDHRTTPVGEKRHQDRTDTNTDDDDDEGDILDDERTLIGNSSYDYDETLVRSKVI